MDSANSSSSAKALWLGKPFRLTANLTVPIHSWRTLRDLGIARYEILVKFYNRKSQIKSQINSVIVRRELSQEVSLIEASNSRKVRLIQSKEHTMKTLTFPGALAALLMMSTSAPFAFVPSANAALTVQLSATSEMMTNYYSSPINTLIAVGPDWLKKLPKVKDAISREVAEHLKNNYARGNRRDAWVEAVEARGTKLYLRAKVRHHHVWSGPLGKITMYDVTNTIETSFDPLNPGATLDNSRMCFNLAQQIGGGKICVSASNIVRIIVALL